MKIASKLNSLWYNFSYMRKINTQGFAIAGIVFTIIFLMILGIAGFYLYNSPKNIPAVTPPQITESAIEIFDNNQLPSSPPLPLELTQTSKSSSAPTKKVQIIVKQSGGSAMLIAECGDKSFIAKEANYIIDGIVEKVESKWNDEKTSIFTYTDLHIEKYVKGTSFTENKLQIITPGGEVKGIGQSVEDQPIFHQGKKVRIYFQNTSEGFSIVCAQAGVEEI